MFKIPSTTIIKNMLNIIFLATIITAAISPGSFSGTGGIIAGITGTGIVKAATPGVTNVEASDVTSTGAALNGILEETGDENVTVSSESGITNLSGSIVLGAPSTVNSDGYSNTNLTGLTPVTTCHFRVNTTGSGTSYVEETARTTSQLPATVTITTFNITPSTAQTGDLVNVSVTCTNTGGSPCAYPVIFKINGVSEYADEVSLAPGESQLVTCGITESNSGTYEVNVNGFSGSFIVQESPGSTGEFDWLLIAGIVGGTLVAGFTVLYIFRCPMVEDSY